jgi:hypothetical protein
MDSWVSWGPDPDGSIPVLLGIWAENPNRKVWSGTLTVRVLDEPDGAHFSRQLMVDLLPGEGY